MKRISLLFIFIFLLLFCNLSVSAANSTFVTYAAGYGFTISGDVTPLVDSTTGFIDDSTVVYRKDKLEHETSYVISYFAYDAAPEIKCVIYRVTTKPYQPGRYWGFLGIGSYGDDFLQDSVSVKVQLPSDAELMSYAPMSLPTSQTVSIGAQVGSDGVVGVSFGYSYSINDVTVVNNSSTLSKLYNITYDFNQSNWNEYTTSEIHSYGMLIFRYSGIKDFSVDINVKYHDYNGFESGLSNVDYNVDILN